MIIELRVPPTSVGSVTLLGGMIGKLVCMATPTLANLPMPWPLVIGVGLTLLTVISTFFLPTPGLYLPKNEKGATHMEKCTEAVATL